MLADYEATVSTGLEKLAKDELREKVGATARTQKGRIWFTTDAPIEKLLNLKSICNLYVIIYSTTLKDEELPADGTCLEPLLMEVGENCNWTSGLSKWHQVCNFTCCLEQILTNNADLRSVQPKFRVSCNRHGPEHKFTSPQVCSVFGHVLDTKFGWPIKMKDYDLEVVVNVNLNHLYVAITLTTIALDRRNIVATGMTTLRAATCYALLRLARIQCGDIVVDPMAGSGAIPVECCFAWPDEWLAYSLAGEIAHQPLGKCRTNLDIFSGKPPSDILQLDVTSLPFRDNSIDVFVSDLPFGHRHGSKKINRILYPALLRNMARACRLASGRAVLLTQDIKALSHAYSKNRDFWRQGSCTFVKIGNLNCYVSLFTRNDRKFDENIY